SVTDLNVLAKDQRLGSPRIHVIDAVTGRVIFDLAGSDPAPTASVLKVLTSAAALELLGPDYRACTRVVAGAGPDEVVVVGGGDLTLTRTPTGFSTFYPGAAHVDDLARHVRAARSAQGRGPIGQLSLDAGAFSGPVWLADWNDWSNRVEDGNMPYITALEVDADRDDPTAGYVSRGTDPVTRAGHAIAA